MNKPFASSPIYQIISAPIEGLYRYVLHAETSSAGAARLAVIQINPSLAREGRSDATVGKVANWAQREGYKKIEFLNLFAYIQQHQDDIPDLPYSTLVGPRNDDTIKQVVSGGCDIIIAWGKPVGRLADHYENRIAELRTIIGTSTAFHIGKLSYGCFPRHGRAWNKPNHEKNALQWDAIQRA